MKTYKQLSLSLALVGLVAVFGIGCSNSKSSNDIAPEGGNGVRDQVSTTSYYGADSTKFYPVSLQTFSNYVALHPLNAPRNFILTVNLVNTGGGLYGGDLLISYEDNGQVYTGSFITGDGVNLTKHNPYYGLPDVAFNKWFYWNGQKVFHAFFQDSYGAVILVIDGGIDLGDGGGMTRASGSVWYKNFTSGRYPQYEEPCWFVTVGPFMCPAFQVNETIVTTSALYPSNGFVKLGSFEGLDVRAAFNQ